MKRPLLLLLLFSLSGLLTAGIVEKSYSVTGLSLRANGPYHTVIFDGAKLSGIPGEPSLPYLPVSLLLPPGEHAVSIEIIRSNELTVPGTYTLFPEQNVSPLSKTPGSFLKNDAVYARNNAYPVHPEGKLLTQFLNGYGFALSTVTPVSYNPATGKISYFGEVTVRILTEADRDAEQSLSNLTGSERTKQRVLLLAQNPELLEQYPAGRNPKSSYQYLIITPQQFQSGYQNLVNYYQGKGIQCQVATTEMIGTSVAGTDIQDKIRNYIKLEYQSSGIDYVLLGGTETLIPSRRAYCVVYYNGTTTVEEESFDIPADIYYSALDGTWDGNGNGIYGEEADNTDLLPEVAVGRFPFVNATELSAMVHKSVSYQESPVEGEFQQPMMAGEYLYDTPITLGGDYMDLLIGDHGENGYFTYGIPTQTNTFKTLYDTLTGLSWPTYWAWDASTLVTEINNGTSFIHHLGHANYDYALRLSYWDITNSNFSQVDGVQHNYSLIYTQGCNCGGFDNPNCIASRMLAIENFAAAGIFNSRFGWFDQGTTEGPSQHLQREFVSALYDPAAPEHHIGITHLISKIKTAPWIGLPGEFEPGAQRWTQYDCTLFGDPALFIRTTNDGSSLVEPLRKELAVNIYPNPAQDQGQAIISLDRPTGLRLRIETLSGQSTGVAMEWNNLTSGPHTLTFPTAGLAPGLYFCRFETATAQTTVKLVISR